MFNRRKRERARLEIAVLAYLSQREDRITDDTLKRRLETMKFQFSRLEATELLLALAEEIPADRPLIQPWLAVFQTELRIFAEKSLDGRATYKPSSHRRSSEAERIQAMAEAGAYYDALKKFREGDSQPALTLISAQSDEVRARASRAQKKGHRRPPFALFGLRMNAQLARSIRAASRKFNGLAA